MIPRTRSRYLTIRRSNAATSPACTCLTTARSASASSLRSGDATRAFPMALLAFMRRGQGIAAGVSWQIETADCPGGRVHRAIRGPSSSGGPQRGDLRKQDVAEGEQVRRRQTPGPLGEGRARGRDLALDGRLDRVEYAEIEHLLQAERGLRREEAAYLP